MQSTERRPSFTSFPMKALQALSCVLKVEVIIVKHRFTKPLVALPTIKSSSRPPPSIQYVALNAQTYPYV